MLKKQTIPQRRSWPVTIIAGLLTLAVLAFALLLLPLKNGELIFSFIIVILVAIFCGLVAVSGRRGALRELVEAIAQLIFLH